MGDLGATRLLDEDKGWSVGCRRRGKNKQQYLMRRFSGVTSKGGKNIAVKGVVVGIKHEHQGSNLL